MFNTNSKRSNRFKSFSRKSRNKRHWPGSGRESNGGRHSFGGRHKGQNTKIHHSKYINQAIETQVEEQYIVKNTFSDFKIDNRLKSNIAARDYERPTPIQDQVIPLILEEKDVVGIANTGTGKTAAFLIPILNNILKDSRHKALIMAPTRELAIQIEDELYKFSKEINFYSVLCIGGASIGPQMHDLRGPSNVVIGTPGRLMDLLKRGALDLSTYNTVVLDEVDRMVDIGFINDIKFIVSKLPEKRQSLFFSATLSPDLQPIIESFLKDPVFVSVKTKETAQTVEQDIIKVNSKEEKIHKLLSLLNDREFSKVIVFRRTKWNVERLSKQLTKEGVLSASIHGNKSQSQRLRALEDFKRGRLQVLVATDIAARGLDINDVSHVINFDEPATYEDYVHRIGRTGRANKRGKALTFVM